ncbi:unnamed protein product [Gadus morhua 'NCC']
MAIEGELVWAGAINSHPAPQLMVRSAREKSEDSQKPTWVDELTELVRAVIMQADRRSPSRRGQRVCWGCGQQKKLLLPCHPDTQLCEPGPLPLPCPASPDR